MSWPELLAIARDNQQAMADEHDRSDEDSREGIPVELWRALGPP